MYAMDIWTLSVCTNEYNSVIVIKLIQSYTITICGIEVKMTQKVDLILHVMVIGDMTHDNPNLSIDSLYFVIN